MNNNGYCKSFNQGKSGSILSVERMDSLQYRQLYGELCCLQKFVGFQYLQYAYIITCYMSFSRNEPEPIQEPLQIGFLGTVASTLAAKIIIE